MIGNSGLCSVEKSKQEQEYRKKVKVMDAERHGSVNHQFPGLSVLPVETFGSHL